MIMVTVNDKMQKNYRYELSEPEGEILLLILSQS